MRKYKALEVAVHAASDKQISLTDPMRDPWRRAEGYGHGRLQCPGRCTVQLGLVRKHIFLLAAEPERAVEVVVALPSRQQAFGLERPGNSHPLCTFEVRQVAQRSEAERLQEFPRRHIGEGGAGFGTRMAPSIRPRRLRAAMTSRLTSRPANLEISPRVTG